MKRLPTAFRFLAVAAVVLSATASSVAAQVLKTDTLPMGTQEALRFYGNNKAHPAYLLNGKGLWVFGATIVLTQPDGVVHRLDFLDGTVAPGESSRLHVVGLDDDSVLAVLVQLKRRDGHSVQFFRVTLQGGKAGLKLQQLVSAPKLGNDIGRDIAAIKLTDGRVLVSGVYSGGPGSRREMQFWLYNPRNDGWQATGSMNHTRMGMAFEALPDGRAFVAGGYSDRSVTGGRGDANYVRGESDAASRSAELWDPRTGRWEMLPPMPLSFKINAHNATAPSAAALPDGSLVVGGGMHRHVVLLRAKGRSFAPNWTIAGSTPGHRVGGIVQALGNNEVVVLDGVAPLPNSEGCCRRQTGGDRIAWTRDGAELDRSLSLEREDAAVAHRGDVTFAAGGWETFMFSSPETQASAVAELIDHRNGRVRVLSPLPQPMLAGRAVWLDDDRVLVKAVAHSGLSEQSFRGIRGINDRSLGRDPSGFLAIYSMHGDTWTSLDDPRIASAALVGIAGKEVVLMSPDTRVWAVTPVNFSVRELPRLVQARNGAVSRTFPDGRIVVAGGKAQSEVMQAIDADCDRPTCPAVPFAYGALQPSRRHEIFSPGTGSWQLSAQSQGAGESAVVRADGRVVTLGLISPPSLSNQEASRQTRNRWLIEESNGRGTNWHTLPLPAGVNDIETQDGASCGRDNSDRKCMLLLGEHPSIGGDVVFLLRERWDYKLPGQRHDLWIFSDDTKQWASIARDMTREQLDADRILRRRADGKALYGSVFQPHKVRLWVK